MKTRGILGTLCVALAAVAVPSAGAAQTGATKASAPGPGPASPAGPPAVLDDFAWLEGTWRGPGPGGATAEVHYMAPAAGVLPSVFRLWRGERVVVLETITLVEEDDGLMLYVRHFTPALEPLEAERALTLRLTEREDERFVFENLYDENPRRTILERTGPDGLLSVSELLREDGSVDEIRVEYRRAGAVTGASPPDARRGRR